MELTDIIFLFVAHWICDFIFQDEDWALNKSTSIGALTAHVATYSSIMLFLTTFYGMVASETFYILNYYYFTGITFAFHWITDYFTSKIVKRKFETNHYGSEIPNFGAFTMIGFDQVLHYVQLFVTWKLLSL